MTVGLLAGGSYGLSLLKQDFDPDWFLPPNAWTVKYNQANDKVGSNIVQLVVECMENSKCFAKCFMSCF